MAKKILWFPFAILATLIGFYPVIYFLNDGKFGLLNSKTDELLANIAWNTGFYTHIVLGGLALLTGWIQFSEKFRNRNLKLHRLTGKIYVIAVLLSATAGIYIGFFASGGIVAASGFISLGIIWFYTTLMAYLHIKNKRLDKHKQMMIYSYAACFAAVTLRIWLPLLMMGLGDFITSYRIVAWLCWVPNLLVAFLMVRSAAVSKI